MLPGSAFKLPGAGLIALAIAGIKLFSTKRTEATINP